MLSAGTRFSSELNNSDLTIMIAYRESRSTICYKEACPIYFTLALTGL